MTRTRGASLALLAVSALLVAACGDDGKPKPSESSASTVAATQPPPATTAPAAVVVPALAPVTVTGAKPRQTAPLAEIEPSRRARAGEDPDADVAEDAVAKRRRTQRVAEPRPDGALDPGTDLRAAPGPISRFTGIRDDIEPPDAMGAIGEQQFVLATNSNLLVLGRDGTRLKRTSIDDLWESAGGPCADTPRGDPALIWDEDAHRFILTQFAFDGDELDVETFQCLAITDGPDALGTWTVHSFRWGDRLHDYPKIGVTAGAYTLTGYTTTAAGKSLTRMALVDRAAVLAGDEPTVQMLDVGPGWLPLVPADADGQLPPAGSPAVFAGISDDTWGDGASDSDEVVIVQVPVDFAAAKPAATVHRLAAASFDSTLCDTDFNCLPQPSGGRKLDPLAEYTMSRVQARVAPDGTARLVLAADVQAGAENRSGVRWFEVLDPYGTPSIAQQGTFAPDDDVSRFIASPAVDDAGNLAIAYDVTGTDVKPGVRYAARTVGDPPGRLPIAEGTLIEGEGVQKRRNRWGDYASLSVDPADGCTLWLAGQFAPADGDGAAVDVVTFRLPGCG
jgi:hypothetical protein